MPISELHRRSYGGFLAALALLELAAGLSGCAGMSDTVAPAFADPAKYDLYDCKQLETERKSLATRTAELQGLMTKAESGVDYISTGRNTQTPPPVDIGLDVTITI